jgi:fumarate hydratase subunit alpha
MAFLVMLSFNLKWLCYNEVDLKGGFTLRKISEIEIINAVERMCIDSNYFLPDNVMESLQNAMENETNELGKKVLATIIENDEIAKNEFKPMCQDTGVAVFFVELGNEVQIDGDLYEAIDEGVRRGYANGFLRKSVVKHPINRVNTGDNTPAIVHLKWVKGDKLSIKFAPKGAGSENMSRLTMLKPADGIEGVREFVIDTVQKAGGNACPPIIVGVGIGGDFEKSAILAKKAVFREVDDIATDEVAHELEKELYVELNKLNIGPMGYGGSQTVLAVKVETAPCHIASLTVAVNIQCHEARKAKVVL